MKLLKAAAIGIVFLMGAMSAFAQGPAPAPKPPSLPKGKMAFLDSSAFSTEINELKEKLDALTKQFELRTREVQALADKITSQETTLRNQRQILSAARIAELEESIYSMKVDYQRKATDVQESAKREQEKIFTPFSEKLRKFAAEFTAKREIVILVDLGNAGGALLWYDPRADVTKDFVAEYNKANPVSSPAQK